MEEKYFNKLIEFMQLIPFNQYLGMHIDELADGFARMSLPYRDEFMGDIARPALHGGVSSALIDTCGGAALITKIEPNDRLCTIDLRIDYLRPGQCEGIVVEARVLRIGNRVGVVDMTAFHDNARDKPIAIGRGSYNIIRNGG